MAMQWTGPVRNNLGQRDQDESAQVQARMWQEESLGVKHRLVMVEQVNVYVAGGKGIRALAAQLVLDGLTGLQGCLWG